MSRSAATKYLLNTLGHKSNPITHSDMRQRSGTSAQMRIGEFLLLNDMAELLVSCSTGHQVAQDGGRGRREYLEFRHKKIRNQIDQMQDSNSGVLKGTRIYINGYLDNTTDIEMKRMITSAGGRVMYAPSMLVMRRGSN
jgi:hypothetical protein